MKDLLTQIAAGVACMTIAAGIIAIVADWRGIVAGLDHDQRCGYRLPAQAKPKSRPCPPWIDRATGRTTR
ncbi:MAG TPA: hypothetical protein VK163_05535 [Opitutaceae bacterium]|nr:hypothetical protein [Opitutaceae bacterium]